MKAAKLSLMVLILALAVSLAGAQSDFKLSSGTEVSLCPCSNQEYNVLLQNLNPVQQSYDIRTSGAAAGWVTIEPAVLTLEANTAAYIKVTVNSPCNIEGPSDLNIFAVASTGEYQYLTQSLDFLACYDYSLSLGKPQEITGAAVEFEESPGTSFDVCEGSSIIIPILVENRENFGNSYTSSLSESKGMASLSPEKFDLAANSRGLMVLKADALSRGNYPMSVRLVSGLGQVIRQSNLTLNVQNCYDFSLETDKSSLEMCGGDKEQVSVAVKNNGDIAQNIVLSAQNADFVSFGNISSFTIAASSERKINLAVSPKPEDSGQFKAVLLASNENINSSAPLSIQVTGRNACYSSEVDFYSSLANHYTHEVYPVTIKNNGIAKSGYNLSVQGPEWVSVSPGSIEVNMGKEGIFNLLISPPEDAEQKTYEITINAKTHGETYSKSFSLELKQENPILKRIKSALNYYQYYIYAAVAMLFLIAVLWMPAKRRIQKAKEQYALYKERAERQRQREEERRAREEQRRIEREEARRKREEEKRKKAEQKAREQERKKARLEKKAEKRLKKFSAKDHFIAAGILVLIAAFALLFSYGKGIVSYAKNFILLYQLYFVAGIVILALLLIVIRFGKPFLDFLMEDDRK